jgi:arsenate reductase
MAEALLRRYAGDRYNVHSAGLRPAEIHPLVEPVMKEIGVDISGQSSKGVDKYLGRFSAQYVIIVCEQAERQCPKLFPGALQRLVWPFEDPAAVEGSPEDRLAAFRRVRDEIDTRLRAWLAEQGTA